MISIKDVFLDINHIKMVLDDLGCKNYLNGFMRLSILEDNDEIKSYNINVSCDKLKKEEINILYVLIESQNFKKGTILFINPLLKTSWWWDPKRENLSDKSLSMNSIIKTLINDYLQKKGYIKFLEIEDKIPNNEEFYNSYILKFIVDWCNNEKFNGEKIKEFTQEIFRDYKNTFNKNIKNKNIFMGELGILENKRKEVMNYSRSESKICDSF